METPEEFQPLITRIYRRLCEQVSFLRHPENTVDWRLSAIAARDEVQAIRCESSLSSTHCPAV